MKEYLKNLIQSASSRVEALNQTREYIQALILQGLQRAGAMTALAFPGGTSLRFLYSLPRYSEDLDFVLEGNAERYDFRSILQAIRKDIEAQGYNLHLKVNDQKAVHSAFIRFSGLPNVQHHDRASLLARKLHAILQRLYMKGRDLYDLVWYLSDRKWPAPNLTLLNHALAQTDWSGPNLTLENWHEVVRMRIEAVSFEQASMDVRPFLASDEDIKLVSRENLLRLLK